MTLALFMLQWFPEIIHDCPQKPVVLVGTKRDLRDAEFSPEKIKESQAKVGQRTGSCLHAYL